LERSEDHVNGDGLADLILHVAEHARPSDGARVVESHQERVRTTGRRQGEAGERALPAELTRHEDAAIDRRRNGPADLITTASRNIRPQLSARRVEHRDDEAIAAPHALQSDPPPVPVAPTPELAEADADADAELAEASLADDVTPTTLSRDPPLPDGPTLELEMVASAPPWPVAPAEPDEAA
jgi:hypothetical protein